MSSRFDVDDIRKIREYNSLRHIHMTPEDARWYGVTNGQRVRVLIGGERGGIMDHVIIRVASTCSLDFHIDTDDANAFQLQQGQTVRILRE